MLKKISLLLLAISSSYAMESLPTTPTGDNGVKQNIEEVKKVDITSNTDIKNVATEYKKGVKQVQADNKNTINDITNDISILNIDKTVQQLNNINIDKDNNATNNQLLDITEHNINIDKIKTKNEKLVDIVKLEKSKPYKEMTDDEKDWIKLRAYDNFLQSCHIFICIGLARKDANLELREFFYNTNTMKWCVLTGFDPQELFLMELQSVKNFSHYDLYPEYARVQQQFDFVSKYLVYVKKNLRARILKKGCIDKFDS